MSLAWTTIANMKGPTGSPGAPGTSFTWLGSWVSTTPYVLNNVVSRLGSTYMCAVANTNVDPNTDGGTHWQLMAQAGTTGSQGIQGTTGATGSRGSIYQPAVANFSALPTIDGVTVAIGDLCFDAAGNLYQVTGP
jgi:hypothetical protein